MVIALAAIAVPAVTASGGLGNVLGEAEFQSNQIDFPAGQDANYDQMTVGNDKAIAVSMPGWFFWGDPIAKNNLNIEKIQKSGDECKSCCEAREGKRDTSGIETSFEPSPEKCSVCANACSLINLEQIQVGTRSTIASGPHTFAENNVNIKTVQV